VRVGNRRCVAARRAVGRVGRLTGGSGGGGGGGGRGGVGSAAGGGSDAPDDRLVCFCVVNINVVSIVAVP